MFTTDVKKGRRYIRKQDRAEVRVMGIAENWVVYSHPGSEVPGLAYISYFVTEFTPKEPATPGE